MENKKIEDVVSTEVVDTPVNELPATEQPAEKKPEITLFNRLGFEKLEHFDEFIGTLKAKNYNNILAVIDISLRSVTARGLFSLEENEIVSAALRNLTSAFTLTETPAVGTTPE